ncbi:MAG: M20/M25/M40 family metallo-hydrolase [candidate division WS1 bacterium]|nr:M20/M25/M40 family metallo-hydrolase [candidate division WS1 bacterium]
MSEVTPQQVAQAIDARAEAARGWLMDAIAFESTQGNEAGVQAYMKDLLNSLGMKAEYREISDEIFEDPEYSHNENELSYEGRPNVVGVLEGTGDGRSVIVQSHTDVVPGADWKEAFDPKFDGEYVYGRGAMDAKGQVIMQTLAIAAIMDMGIELKGSIEQQVVLEEEVGGNGALSLIRQGCSADGVIVGEGSSLNVYPANRGAIWFRAKTFGTPMHMGRRFEGQNAIEKMMEAIRLMLIYEKKIIAESANYPLFERYEAPVQLCLGIIRAEGWPSMVAGECMLEGGVGFLPNKSMEEVKQELYDAVMQTEDQWLKDHFELTFPKLHNDSYEIPGDHPLPVTLNDAVTNYEPGSEIFGWNVSCDARLYNRLADLPTVVYGASDIQEAHSDNEKVAMAELVKGAKGLALGIINWCNG